MIGSMNQIMTSNGSTSSCRSRFSALLLFFVVLMSGARGRVDVFADTKAQQMKYAPDSVIVRFKTSARTVTVATNGLQAIDPAVATFITRSAALQKDFQPVSTLMSQQTNLYKITDGSTVEAKIAELRAHPEVALAEPNYKVTIFKTPSDGRYTAQWHLPKIAAPIAWDTVTGSKKVKVCVIDSGVRIDHPDLAGNVIKGWNVIQGTPVDEFYNYNDTQSHGTHVAGLVAALGNNARGVSGVAWQVSLLICKFITDQGMGDIYDAIKCMRLCRDEGALVYSNSWGGVSYPPEGLLEEIEALQATNGVFVVAAGNAGSNLDISPRYPASYNAINQITVAATTTSDGKAGFSDFGPRTVHVAAPGEGILSTFYDGGYDYLSGTSMATPLVSGAAALLQAMALNANNTPLSPQKIRSLLMNTSDATSWGPSAVKSGGRINVARAVAALKSELGGYTDQQPPLLTPAVPLLPQQPRPTNAPPPPENTNNVGTITPPECGTSSLRDQPANQSSVAKSYVAGFAVNGDCRNEMSTYPAACAATDPSLSYPWWFAPLPQRAKVLAVSITTRADCCWNAIGGARIFIGESNWVGPESIPSFTECGVVPNSDNPRGQRITITCSNPISAAYVVVYLPKVKTSLVLCEVDVTLEGQGTSSSIVPAGAASPQLQDLSEIGNQAIAASPSQRKLKRTLLFSATSSSK